MPQLGKRGLDALPHLSQQVLFLRGIGPCENQHARFRGPLGGSCLAPITEIAEGDATLDPFEQGQYRGTVIPVAGVSTRLTMRPSMWRSTCNLKPKNQPLLVLPNHAPSSRSRRTRRCRTG